ncbi:MAG: amidase family protein [Polyangiales bacterium]
MHPLDRLATLDATAQSALVQRGELTATDLLSAAQRRCDAINPLIRAVVAVDFDAARAQISKRAGAVFEGVPFACKDLLMVPGMRCAFGSRLLARNVAAQGSPFTDKLERAGLVTFAKTATSEFGLLGSSETLLEGVTHNPWNLTLSAAGSSGGSAAAVAAGIVAIAHASDGGGSVRIPAAANGVFGFKPSRGRTAPSGPESSPFERLVSDGCVSRSVRDAATFFDAVQRDGQTLPSLNELQFRSPKRLRIALSWRSMMGTEPESAVRIAIERAAALCEQLGHTVIEAEVLPQQGAAISEAFFTSAGASLAAMTAMIAPMLGRQPGDEELEPFTLALIEHARSIGDEGIAAAQRTFDAAASQYLAQTAPFDVVLTPVIATRPWSLGWLAPTLSREALLARTEQAVCYTPIQNIAGCPAMSVPLHWTEDGTPIGAHFAAAPSDDATLFALAFELERACPWADRWAPHSFVSVYHR